MISTICTTSPTKSTAADTAPVITTFNSGGAFGNFFETTPMMIFETKSLMVGTLTSPAAEPQLILGKQCLYDRVGQAKRSGAFHSRPAVRVDPNHKRHRSDCKSLLAGVGGLHHPPKRESHPGDREPEP